MLQLSRQKVYRLPFEFIKLEDLLETNLHTKNQWFFYTKKQEIKNGILINTPFTIATKAIKYIRINLINVA